MLRTRMPRHHWLRVASALMVVAILLSALPAASLAAGPATLQFTGTSGAVMGSGTLVPAASGQTTVQISVKGFNPVGGDRALVITQVGYCYPPNFRLYAGANVYALPPIQFYPDGSANYSRTLTIPDYAVGGTDGSALLILADASLSSDVIACAVIVPTGYGPIVTPPAPPVPPLPPLPPVPVPPSPTPSYFCSLTPPAVATTTVVASEGLKLRTGPSLTRWSMMTLPNGTVVYPMEEPTTNQGISWVRVRVFRYGRCYEGYVAATYLARWAGTTPTVGEWRVTAPAGLRLRAGPGTSYQILRIVPLGTRLGFTGIEQSGSGIVWAKVTIGSSEYWAATAYLERTS
ncbi:MAG: SH3 domain-containing protein [Anaerolineae bacterium]